MQVVGSDSFTNQFDIVIVASADLSMESGEIVVLA